MRSTFGLLDEEPSFTRPPTRQPFHRDEVARIPTARSCMYVYLRNERYYSCGWNRWRETLVGEWMNNTPFPIAEDFTPLKRFKTSAQEDDGKRALERKHESSEAQKSHDSEESWKDGTIQQMEISTLSKTNQSMGINTGCSFLRRNEEPRKYEKVQKLGASKPPPKVRQIVSTNNGTSFLPRSQSTRKQPLSEG